MLSTTDYLQVIERLRYELTLADAVIIGAGAGLSIADGLRYSGERFERSFADFITKYHYQDMYSAGFYPYSSSEEYWAYWSRHIYLNRYAYDTGEVYHNLLELVKNKNCFVITTNVDHCFQKAGFDITRLFYTQGDYGLWQCEEPCHQKTYSNEETVRRMVEEQSAMRIPTELIPSCPRCGKAMTNNLRCDNRFVEDESWHTAAQRYTDFLREHKGKNILFLELGVGSNTPAIIKYPFWNMTFENENAVYACINLGETDVPREIKERSICIDADIKKIVESFAR